MSKPFEYASEVRGCHYYRQYWQPEESQALDYAHKKDNPFDIFAIKVMDRNSGATVGHLPMENSRAIKFILDRGARVFATLTSTKKLIIVSHRWFKVVWRYHTELKYLCHLP